ncbi:protein PAT1 homolog 1-like isoform X2 [Pomacea canaliculata]|uniref:protein PAT1 homolog 1-like isoform X2 n=1 Tax=Pomacea canaliculata TaxID=400727 RepID=UPI000D73614E|nr:protein PAT1 homolog 1-like isoform X2 [Pomacea canaliculata]
MASTLNVKPDSAFSALGAGTVDAFDNELQEAPEEEDFDGFNDETFGASCPGEDFNWEQEHERLAEEEENETTEFHHRDHTKDSGYGNAERSYRSQEEYHIEESISRLIVEDEDEESLPVRIRSRPIPAIKASPGRNIWGSPAHEDIFHKPTDALQKLFQSAKAVRRGESPVPILPHPLPPQSPAALPQAHTLEEIERLMLARGKKPQVITAEELERKLRGDSTPGNQAASTPHVVGPLPQFPLHPLPQLRPGLLPASLLLNDQRSPFPVSVPVTPIGHAVQPTTPSSKAGILPLSQQKQMANGRSSPIPIMTPKAMPPGSMLAGSPQLASGRHTSTPTPPPGMVSLFQPPPTARLVSPYNRPVTPVNNGISPATLGSRRLGLPPNVIPPLQRGPVPSSPVGTPPGGRLSAHGIPDISSRSKPPIGDWRHDGSRHETGVTLGNRTNQSQSDKNRAYRTNYQRPPPWQQHHQHQDMQQAQGEEDEYAGLMTKREKDWIIKIQLLQLNTDNPYLDDYYFTYYTLRKKMRERFSGGGDADLHLEPTLLIPNLSKIETKAYTPAHFEGSLGRLTTASVHNPRQIIDVARGSSPLEDTSKKNVSKELRKFRQLLMDIEKGYTLLLDIDDIEKKVLALPEESRIPLFLERHEKIGQLYQYFTSDESIEQHTQILGVRKGRKLLARVLPLFSKNQAHVALCILFHHMYNLVKKDVADEGLSLMTRSVCSALEGSDLDALVRLVDVLKGEKWSQSGSYLDPLFTNQFGAAVLCSLLQQGEKVYCNTSPVDMDNQLQTEWSKFVEEFADGLKEISLKDLAPPSFALPLVTPHLTRLLNAQVLVQIEDKVQRLTTPSTANASLASFAITSISVVDSSSTISNLTNS